MSQEFSEQELIRREKLKGLVDAGIEPFGHSFSVSHHSAQIEEQYAQRSKEELEEIADRAIIAGRVMTKRLMGKAGFMHIQDRDGQIQVYVRKDVVGDEPFEYFKNLDLGDILGVEGIVFRTNHGELSLKAEKLTHLTKALRPLPDKWHGLVDKEERFRRRYVDLIVNEDARKVAMLRPRIIRSIQHYFDDLGLIEVETPILQPILGGAAARPFVTHHNTLDMDFYLRIATELPLKRLIVGGLEGVYEIGRLFRNEGMDPMHNPEFTTVEAYMAYKDMKDIMVVIENCFEKVAMDTLHSSELTMDGETISLKGSFKRIHMVDSIKEVTGIDFFPLGLDEALALAKEHHIELDKHKRTYGHIVNEFFEKYVEETLIQPTFVYGHPIDISPLAKKNAQDPRFAERFECFILGHEYANAFSELNDPIDQRERFEAQLAERELGNDEANEMDVDYVEALEYGLPPTGGLGIGIDRLVMLITGVDTIREVILFPHMRKKSGE